MKRRVSIQYDMETEIIGLYDKDTGELDFDWDDSEGLPRDHNADSDDIGSGGEIEIYDVQG